ncbi:MAG: deoxyhypusine synthase family protein [Deltaproteobacteria bacterium]|nr:deoxyhypusine synthase family protein [Deltaproteobacteria bacterium]
MSRYKEIDLSGVRRISFETRTTKVDATMFGRPDLDSDDFGFFFDGLPDILAARDLKTLAVQTAAAIRNQKPIVLMMGAHLIKCGVSPLLCQLMRRGVVSTLVTNGAGLIHDFEVALFGRTSEDVAASLETGLFGFVEETGIWLNEAMVEGAAQGWGMGEAAARKLQTLPVKHPDKSLLLTAFECGVPLTVHSAIGTETIHQHPETDGAAIGETTYRDFKILCEQLTRLEGGMVFLYGSAVILPEVFLKALTVVRNLGHTVKQFTAVNFDMIRHYRPQENVVSRPTRTGGHGFTIVGHHELLIPLFWQGVYHELRKAKSG